MESPLDYLPEFLLGATFLTGVIWFIDVLRWRPARLAAAAELEARTAESEQDGDADDFAELQVRTPQGGTRGGTARNRNGFRPP